MIYDQESVNDLYTIVKQCDPVRISVIGEVMQKPLLSFRKYSCYF